jgi:hypothetical protein
MELAPGTRLGPYEILHPIGARASARSTKRAKDTIHKPQQHRL